MAQALGLMTRPNAGPRRLDASIRAGWCPSYRADTSSPGGSPKLYAWLPALQKTLYEPGPGPAGSDRAKNLQ